MHSQAEWFNYSRLYTFGISSASHKKNGCTVYSKATILDVILNQVRVMAQSQSKYWKG